MRITQQFVLRVIGGAVGAGIWSLALAAAVAGVGAVLAPVVGTAIVVLVTDRWHGWRNGDRIGIVAFVGGFGAGIGWAFTPWLRIGDGMLLPVVAILLAVATQALWWAIRGYRYDKPRAPSNPRDQLLLPLLFVVAVIIGWIIIRMIRTNGFVF
jgi:hypothetical protein